MEDMSYCLHVGQGGMKGSRSVSQDEQIHNSYLLCVIMQVSDSWKYILKTVNIKSYGQYQYLHSEKQQFVSDHSILKYKTKVTKSIHKRRVGEQ